jgi:hypothetical protein
MVTERFSLSPLSPQCEYGQGNKEKQQFRDQSGRSCRKAGIPAASSPQVAFFVSGSLEQPGSEALNICLFDGQPVDFALDGV